MNKTYLTVAQIFAIISGVALCFAFILIFPLVLGILNFKAASVMNQAKNGEATKEQVRNWSIYLIFTSLIGGIFGLIAAESKEEGQVSIEGTSLEQKLKDLDSLYDRGLISKEEYELRRKKILESV